MILSMIVAYGNNRQIGLNGNLLWHIPEDLKMFKKVTMGKPIIMGRKTYESIGRALPGRLNIVLTRKPSEFPSEGNLQAVSSLEEGIELAKDHDSAELVICGGGEIYKRYLNHVDKLYISEVDFDGEADTYFPELNLNHWSEVERQVFSKTENTPAWKFTEYRKN